MKLNTESMQARFIEENIIETRPADGWSGHETIEHAGANMALLSKMIGNRKVGLLSYLPDTYIDAGAKSYYRNHPQIVVAAALIAQSLIQTTIGNFFIKFDKTTTPTRMFTNEKDAKTWLLKKLHESNSAVKV